MTRLDRYPWRLELADGTTVNEHEDGRERAYPELWERPDIKRFSFLTPAGEVGVDHDSGRFFVMGNWLRHPLYLASQRNSYRHWHRVGRWTDFAPQGGMTSGVTGYSVGMERSLEGSSEILFVRFPHNLTGIGDVEAWVRIKSRGLADKETKTALAGRV